jgi:ketosteroid isomerase-like protein
MKSSLLKGVIVPFAMLLATACNSKKEEPAAVVIDKEQIKKEIQAREDEFAAVYNSGQLLSIGYYADDAISYSQNRAPLVGKQAIVDFYVANRESAPNSSKLSFTTNEVFVSSDGVQVVEIGYFKLVDANDSIINSGNYMSVFEKRNGIYVSLRDMSTSDMPME